MGARPNPQVLTLTGALQDRTVNSLTPSPADDYLQIPRLAMPGVPVITFLLTCITKPLDSRHL